jgi:hypothetical protein
MLDCCLEGVGAAQLGVCDDQANGPVNGDSQYDEEDDTCKQTGLAKSVGLTNDAGTTAEAGQIVNEMARRRFKAHMILFAMFIKALDIELLGRALSRSS